MNILSKTIGGSTLNKRLPYSLIPDGNKGTSKRKKRMMIIGAILSVFIISSCIAITAFAAESAAGNAALEAIDRFTAFVFGLIRAIGIIILGMGIVQVGLGFKSHDPSQRANGFLTLAGGIVITFTKEILDLIVG